MKLPDRIVIATRESRLAQWQAHFVRDALARLYPSCRVEILGMTTRGDRVLDGSLAKMGGKGLFVKELEAALADGRADIAVHSAKDVPMELADGFRLASILAREDPRDCLVSPRYARLQELPDGAIVGTSSLRREAQLRERHPKIEIRPLRGNIDTRVAKLDHGDFDAIVLASAGLKRLGLGSRIRAMLEPEESLPAPGQGALAIECSGERSDLADWLAPLGDAATAACVRAERAVSRSLSGSCQLPLGAFAEARGGELVLRGLVATADGARVIRAEARGDVRQPEALGERLAQALRAKGADAILAAIHGG
ncbi:MAG: hydroxymethylbilane synthase [Betaproteobacteria bacterium RIFCSPLOWO2_02_FULL_64_12]|nr:MAG: hydroxymethylbilane synthase [Betaproteobacteria bacterium RIFCSPLOWO2_02_FULL_64_12]